MLACSLQFVLTSPLFRSLPIPFETKLLSPFSFADQNLYNSLPAKKLEEDDMLDLAAGLTPTSRLSCQLLVTENYKGAVIIVPGGL
jgi:hypothetical protein